MSRSIASRSLASCAGRLMSPMIQEFAESRIVRWCSIECRGKSLECPRIELEEVAIQENRRGFARCGVEHELRSILPDRLCGPIDQRHTVWTLVSKVCYLAHQGNLTHGVRPRISHRYRRRSDSEPVE